MWESRGENCDFNSDCASPLRNSISRGSKSKSKSLKNKVWPWDGISVPVQAHEKTESWEQGLKLGGVARAMRTHGL
jgi:hypothetical protein